MARPIKNNADYFPHYTNMRNDSRVLAIRRKFGIEGYGIYCMLIESLANAENFKVSIDEMSLEILSGDYGVDKNKLSDVMNYAITIDLIQVEKGLIGCKTLEKLLIPLTSRRVIVAETKQKLTETPQKQDSKVKESKVKESKVLPFGPIFFSAWSEWQEYRKDGKHKMTALTEKKQLSMLSKYTESQAVEIINTSIRNGWTGLFDQQVKAANPNPYKLH
jgi:hypothetical protein